MRIGTAKVRGMAALTLLGLIGCGRAPEAQAQDRAEREVREQLGPVPATIDTITAARLSETFRGAADRALPSVVYVQVVTQPRVARNGQGQSPEDLFFRFFGQPPQQQPQAGAGSGFIFREDGYILTNRHVVQNAQTVVVQLVDGREYDAEIVGTDPNTDVAVLKIDANGEDLPVATLGSSERVRVGDWVLALGNPLGLDFTVTAGIVSAKGRATGILRQELETALEAFIQTDAAINPGNSGGPLVDLLGRVIGINTAISSPTGVNAGYGFAVPIDVAAKVADDLVRFGEVRRPRLGVLVSNVSAADAEVAGLDEVEGAYVREVQEDSPAERAGLRMGDVVVELNDDEIETSAELTTELAQLQPGQRVTLTVVRNGRELEIPVELGRFEPVARTETPREALPAAEERLGFSAEPITPQIARRLEIGEAEGLVVTGLTPLSPAGAAGLRPGMVLRTINGQQVQTQRDLERIARAIQPGQVVSIVAERPQDGGRTIINYRTRR